MVCPPELSPFSLPLPSIVSKQPVPAPRRASAKNKKLTSPTFRPTLPPLEAWGTAQPEEAERPGPGAGGGDGGGGGLNGDVHVAPVKPQVVTQLSAEESR